MIKEVIMYTVICDCCGIDSNFGDRSEFCAFNSQDFAEYMAFESEWVQINEKHYCPECISYDDDDKLVIKTRNS